MMAPVAGDPMTNSVDAAQLLISMWINSPTTLLARLRGGSDCPAPVANFLHDPGSLKDGRLCFTVSLHLGVSWSVWAWQTTNILGLTPGEQPSENSQPEANVSTRFI
jgi:hypothetical protein